MERNTVARVHNRCWHGNVTLRLLCIFESGLVVVQLVEALCHKTGGRGLDSPIGPLAFFEEPNFFVCI